LELIVDERKVYLFLVGFIVGDEDSFFWFIKDIFDEDFFR